jgi:hypothetical protein
MDKFKTLMTKRVAGIPVLAFVAIFGGGLLWYAFKLAPAKDNTDSVTTDANAPDGDPTLTDTSQPLFSATPTVMQPSGVPNSASVTATPQADTNDLWSRRAIEWLIGQGTSVNSATGAITRYLSGESLTADEAKIRDKAIGQYGLPPEDIPYAPDQPKPAAPPTPAVVTPPKPAPVAPPARRQGTPPLVHKVMGPNDNTYQKLALLYYGSNATGLVQHIQANKSNLDHPPRQAFPVGTTIRIPAKETAWYTATKSINTLRAIAAKNGKTPQQIQILNAAMTFPVKPGTRVQVG